MTAKRKPQPGATKRTKLEMASPLALPGKAVEGIRSIFGPDGDHPSSTTPAAECAEARHGTGLDAPEPGGLAPNHLDRSFLFIDVSGFTRYVDQHGEHAAIDVLTRFRSAARDTAARRGVRVAKWLGDGVMLVGTEPGVTAAAGAEMMCRFAGSGLDIHGGMASGPVLLFEGDDYIGRCVNLAARLCDAATEGELLADIDVDDLPTWVRSDGLLTVHVPGVGDVSGVHLLAVVPEVLEDFKARSSAA